MEKRVDRTLDLGQMGKLSTTRHAFEGDVIAIGHRQTLNALQDSERLPPIPREVLSVSIVNHVPPAEIDLGREEVR